MYGSTLIGLAVLLVAVAASPAAAQDGPPDRQPETPAEHIAPYLKRVEAFWADRGGLIDCPFGVTVVWKSMDGATGAAAGGQGRECWLWLDPESWQQRGPHLRCLVILHEYGHLIGLGHDAGGIMADTGMPWHPTKRCQFEARPVPQVRPQRRSPRPGTLHRGEHRPQHQT